MPITTFNSGDVTTLLNDTDTTEAEFRNGNTAVIGAIDAINQAAIDTLTVTQRNQIQPVTVAESGTDENTWVLTSNIVVGTVEEPTTSDFDSGQIYFSIET